MYVNRSLNLPYMSPPILAPPAAPSPSALALRYAPQYRSSDCTSAVVISTNALLIAAHCAVVACIDNMNKTDNSRNIYKASFIVNM